MAVQNSKLPEEIQTAMDASALREVPRLEKRVGLLATVSNVSVLFGLMGTILGLIRAFGSVANVAPVEKATILTGAISEALVATLFGLSTAIFCLIGFGFFSSWSQSLIDDIHESSVATLNFVISNRNKLMKG